MRLYEAGGSRVPANEIAWTADMVPAINFAISMQYIVYREKKSRRLYTLTDAGREAIGLPSNKLTLARAFRLAFGFGK
jgi:hypothetical protein